MTTRGRRFRTSTGKRLAVVPAAPGIPPGTVTNIAVTGTTTTSISISTDALTGTLPLTVSGFVSDHGSGVWSPNSGGTFGSTSDTFSGLASAHNYDLRLVVSNLYGTQTTDYLAGVTTQTALGTIFTIALSSGSGPTGQSVTLTATPDVNGWQANEPVTVVETGLSGSWDATVRNGNGTTPLAFVFTPTSVAGSIGTFNASSPHETNLTGFRTYTISGTAPAASVNKADVMIGNSTGDTSSSQTISVIPNGNWNGGTLPIVATKTGGGTSAVGTLSLPTGGNGTQTLTWTPPSAGEWLIGYGSNSIGLYIPYGAPFNCLASSSGTARTMTVGSSNFLDQQPFQQDSWSGTPSGWSAINGAVFDMGWGEFWAVINPSGTSGGVFARLIDALSSGATTTSGGTLISNIAQVYGAVSAGSQTIRILLPVSDYTTYIELATDSAFTNPVRIPLRFQIRDVTAYMLRSMECGMMQVYPYTVPPGLGWSTYTKAVMNGCQNPDGGSANVWCRADGVTQNDFAFATWGSAGTMETARRWFLRKGHGCALVGLAPAGYNTDEFILSDGSPKPGFTDPVSKCNNKFRYLKTCLNGWNGWYAAESFSEYQTVYGNFVVHMASTYPALSVMALGTSSGQFGPDGSSAFGYTRIGKMITDTIETVNPMVMSADASPDWDEWTSGHATWASQLRYARNSVLAMLLGEGTHAGGFGLSRSDRYATFAGTGRIVSDTLRVGFSLPAGATGLVAKKWLNGTTSSGWTYSTPSASELRDVFDVFANNTIALPGSSVTVPPRIRITGAAIDNTAGEVVLTLDRRAGAGNVAYTDGTSSLQPSTFSVNILCDFHVYSQDISFGVGIFDDRASIDDYGFGPSCRSKVGVVVS